jgi:hypothetical protein
MVTSAACPFVQSLGPSFLIISEEIHFIFLLFHLGVVDRN